MSKKYRVLFVCGTGIATSTAAESKLSNWMSKRGISLQTYQCIGAEVAAKAHNINPHAIVTTTKLKIVKADDGGKTKFNIDGIPGIDAFNGVPFLTGIGEEELVNKIVAALEASTKN